MTMLSQLSDPECWESFYCYKTSLACPKAFASELRHFIDLRLYLPTCGKISRGERFALPKRSVISKLDTSKKRVIYTYPSAENTVLKLLTHLLLRKYDGCFSSGLYSFRPGRTAQQAFRRLAGTKGIGGMYYYKADISDYFNSVDISRLLPMLEAVLGDDRPLYDFLSSLLCEKQVLEKGSPIEESKGIMAGTPTSAFFANLFLSELDRELEELGVPYARYSDDIILFARSREETERLAGLIHRRLADLGLRINPSKENFGAPGESWVFLGLIYRSGIIDIAPASVVKLKAKMRRKMRALMRWQKRTGHTPVQAAKAFIRIFNRKLFEGGADNELTWAYWYFPVITTDESLRVIDRYAQDCLRYLLSGKHTASRFNVRYDLLRELGYRSLVGAYYKAREPKKGD